jgi:phospholipase C
LKAWLPQQEAGVRAACFLPYELTADAYLSPDRKSLVIRFAAGNKLFGERSAGAPFRIYAPGRTRTVKGTWEICRSWNYAVSAGDNITDAWPLIDFEQGNYHLQLNGPNGFYREFRGSAKDPLLELTWQAEGKLKLVNHGTIQTLLVTIEDLAYGDKPRIIRMNPSNTAEVIPMLVQSFGWHDLRIRVAGAPDYEQRYAGHIEIGQESFSDPAMGRIRVAS